MTSKHVKIGMARIVSRRFINLSCDAFDVVACVGGKDSWKDYEKKHELAIKAARRVDKLMGW